MPALHVQHCTALHRTLASQALALNVPGWLALPRVLSLLCVAATDVTAKNGEAFWGPRRVGDPVHWDTVLLHAELSSHNLAWATRAPDLACSKQRNGRPHTLAIKVVVYVVYLFFSLCVGVGGEVFCFCFCFLEFREEGFQDFQVSCPPGLSSSPFFSKPTSALSAALFVCRVSCLTRPKERKASLL